MRMKIVEGEGMVILDGESIPVSAESSVYIPAKTRHTISNTSNTRELMFIEVQTGTYFGEDDIVRVDTSIGFPCQPFILEER